MSRKLKEESEQHGNVQRTEREMERKDEGGKGEWKRKGTKRGRENEIETLEENEIERLE